MNVSLDKKSKISEIKAENNVLLQRIKQLETKINGKKQKNTEVSKTDEKKLNAMVMKSLTLLAKVQTLEVVDEFRIKQLQIDEMVQE